ncbi:MAG: amidohydrolase family protein [Microbacterium ginsengisoli]|jgi:5-methylthioadenosine/S-adenosylhomocysteine deaminase|uniref:amidohydrolase family protein n=1 Tax=Microbacterium TaxID=33882 RepID=UPI0006F20818|nr:MULTISPECIES: amidohydrolase family protein [unclassified Microbacterium]MBN9198074.1 amidohydrolase family protein [Microbacterium ginsengisoli]KQR90724.1 amidohydrolase [Microbacterium sp. Leaf351]KQR96927.1 amidohydrolase [Microbacterium sp. Leaf347]ODU79503.1 MAG: amidohydrolase [Microbacterium sp. SCN 71-21]OJU78532.1 MAG: amidohydrolase [Microbacterium sp. 71-23]
MSDPTAHAEDFTPGRPLVIRNTTVITVDTPGVIRDGDVLVVDDRIAAVGPRLEVPDGTVEIDGSGGILMPGMVDTHRHMWQTALRGYGGDWALSQYFVFYYLQHGEVFRPEDIYAGNLLSALESVDVGVTTTLDWSHALRTPDYADAAVAAFREIPGRFVLGYGNYLGAPWEWSADPAVRRWIDDLPRTDLLGLELAFDVPDSDDFPERAAFDFARDLGIRVTTHAGVWGATGDVGIRNMYDAGVMTDQITYVHSASLGAESYQKIAATGGTVSVATESEQSAGQGYPSTWEIRKYGIPASLSMDTSVWWSADFFSAMRATLSSDRSRDHLEAHRRGETVNVNRLRAEDVVWMATMGGALSLGMSDLIGSITPGKKADLVLLKNDQSPTMTPILNPHAHVVYQAGTADIHTVVIDGRVVKYRGTRIDLDIAPARDAVAASVDYVRSQLGEAAWEEGMHPPLDPEAPIDNPYQYQED